MASEPGTANFGIYDAYRMQGMTQCQWCGAWHGLRCPHVQAIEYHADGTVKRVEFVKPEPINLKLVGQIKNA